MAGSVGVPNQATPSERRFVLVEVRKAWSDEWFAVPELEPIRWRLSSAAAGSGHCELSYPYGSVKESWATSYVTRGRLVMGRNWVRLRLAGDKGLTTVWQGAFYLEQSNMAGSSDGIPRGNQVFVAHDAVAILERINVYQSYWDGGGSVSGPLDHLPHINRSGKNGVLVGNRSTAEVDDSYVYGGTDEWTSRQYIDYLLKRFVNETGRPTFTLGGQTDLLDNVPAPVLLRPVETVRSIISKLISPEFGMDFVPIPTDDGWELRVFSLIGKSSGFASGLLPNNPNEFDIDAADDDTIMQNGLIVETSSRHLYDKLHVIGERIVSCFSLWGLNWGYVDLEEGWTSAQETAYEAGTGTPSDSADYHDIARRADKFKTVFQIHRASAAWDWQSGEAAPDLDMMGFIEGYDEERQDWIRETLRVLPLREGWDYTQDPPVNNNPSGIEADFKPPMAIASFWSSELGQDIDFLLDKPEPLADMEGITITPATISVLEHDLGLLIEMKPNHTLARNHWAGGAADTQYDVSNGLDYDDLVLTIAARTDKRLILGLDVPETLAAGDGSVKVLEVPGAEYWYLAPDTAVDVDETGTVVQSPSTGVVLRNDSDRLADAAAGAFARYLNARAHAEIRYCTLTSSAGLLGQILGNVKACSTDSVYVAAAVTSVEWEGLANGGAGMTIVKTGYAR